MKDIMGVVLTLVLLGVGAFVMNLLAGITIAMPDGSNITGLVSAAQVGTYNTVAGLIGVGLILYAVYNWIIGSFSAGRP